ncbi:MAG: hypothetical protein Q9201_001163 [Fulgogasparrea decipioides]
MVEDGGTTPDSRLKEALTQRKLEHPNGSVVVGLAEDEVGVEITKEVGNPVMLGVEIVKDAEVRLDRESKKTLTHRKSEHPKGRVLVGLPKAELGVDVTEYELGADDPEPGDIDELVVASMLEAIELDAVAVAVASTLEGDEALLDRMLKEALTHSKSEQPKGRVFVGLFEGELEVGDPKIGDTEEVMVASKLEGIEVDVDELVVASTLDSVDIVPVRRLKDALTHSKSEQLKGKVLVELAGGKLGVDDIEEAGNTDVLVPAGKVEEELLCSAVLEEVDVLVKDTVHPEPRLRQKFKHKRLVQVVVGTGVGLVVTKLNGIFDETENGDDDGPVLKIVGDGVPEAVFPRLRDPHMPEDPGAGVSDTLPAADELWASAVAVDVGEVDELIEPLVVTGRSEGVLDNTEVDEETVVPDKDTMQLAPAFRQRPTHRGLVQVVVGAKGEVMVDKLDVPVVVSEDWDKDEPEIAVVDESAIEVRLPEIAVVRLVIVGGEGPLQPAPIQRLEGVDDDDNTSDEVGLDVEGDEQFGPIQRVAHIKPEHDVENDCGVKDIGVVVVLEPGIDRGDLVGDWDVDATMVPDDDDTIRVNGGVDELSIDVEVAEHEGPKQMLKQAPPEQDDVAVVNALAPDVISVEEGLADVINGPLVADPDEVGCRIIVVDTGGVDKELGLEIDVLVSAELADVLV